MSKLSPLDEPHTMQTFTSNEVFVDSPQTGYEFA